MSTFEENSKKMGKSPREQGNDIPKGWKPSLETPLPPVRCISPNEKGEQCGRWSKPGIEQCESHASNLDKKNAQDRIAAGRLRLVGLIDPAIDTLQELLEPGTGEAVRLKAATEILDRSGIPKGQEMKIEVEHHNTAVENVKRQLNEIRNRQKAEQAEKDEDIIDVEEVDDNATDA